MKMKQGNAAPVANRGDDYVLAHRFQVSGIMFELRSKKRKQVFAGRGDSIYLSYDGRTPTLPIA